MHFDAKIEHIVNFDQTLLTCARQLGWCEHRRIDSTAFDRAQTVTRRTGNYQRHVLIGLQIEFLKQDQRRIVRRRTKAADAEPFALELLDLADAGPRHHRIVVRVFRRGDQDDIVPLQARLHDCTDIDDRRIAGDQRLRRHLTAAEKNDFGVEAVLAK